MKANTGSGGGSERGQVVVVYQTKPVLPNPFVAKFISHSTRERRYSGKGPKRHEKNFAKLKSDSEIAQASHLGSVKPARRQKG